VFRACGETGVGRVVEDGIENEQRGQRSFVGVHVEPVDALDEQRSAGPPLISIVVTTLCKPVKPIGAGSSPVRCFATVAADGCQLLADVGAPRCGAWEW